MPGRKAVRKGPAKKKATMKDILSKLVCHDIDRLEVSEFGEPGGYMVTAICTCGAEVWLPGESWEEIRKELLASQG